MKQSLIGILTILAFGCSAPGKLMTTVTPRDSIVVNTRTIHDTIAFPRDVVHYIDTTICPPGLRYESLVVHHDSIVLPGKLVIVPGEVKDSIIYRRDYTVEADLNQYIDSLEMAIAHMAGPTTAAKLNKWWPYLSAVIGFVLVFGIGWLRKRSGKTT